MRSKGFNTSNVTGWITFDKEIYRVAQLSDDYKHFVELMNKCGSHATPDRVKYSDNNLDFEVLNKLIDKIRSNDECAKIERTSSEAENQNNDQ